jgi:hypothetical protein
MPRLSLEEIFADAPDTGEQQSESGINPHVTRFLEAVRNVYAPQRFITTKVLPNIIPSTARGLRDIGTAIVHPAETLKAMGSIAAGGVAKGLGVEPETIYGRPGDIEKFETAGQFFKNRYGSLDAIKKTVEEDPFGVLMDVSGVASGVGTGLRVAGTAGKVSRLGEAGRVLETVGRVTDPLQATGKAAVAVGGAVKKGVGFGASQAVSLFGGRGSEAASVAAAKTITKQGREQFTSILRSKGIEGRQNLANLAQEGLETIQAERSAAYVPEINRIRGLNTPLDPVPIQNNLINKLIGKENFNVHIEPTPKGYKLDFSESTLPKGKDQRIVKELVQDVLNWQDNTVGGWDILKRRVDSLFVENSQARAVVQAVKSQIRDRLNAAVPEYEKLTSDYSKTTNLINEIRKDLALGDTFEGGRAVDRVNKRLISAMRDDPGVRIGLIKEIQKRLPPGSDIEAQIAGAVLQPVLPTGIVGRSALLALLGGSLFIPKLIPVLAFGSPRLVGEFLVALGHTRQQANRMVDLAKKAGAFERATGQIAFQAGRLPEAFEKKAERPSLEEIFKNVE